MSRSQYQKRQEDKEFLLWQECRDLTNKELIPLLDDNDSAKRRIAASYLQLNGGVEVIQLAKLYCLDKRYQRRTEGAFILGQIKLSTDEEQEVIDLLYKLALKDKSVWVRDNALAAMGHRCGRNSAFSSILVQLSSITVYDKSHNVRFSTAAALSRIKDELAIPILLKLLKDSDGDVRDWAAFAINMGEYDSPEIRDIFVDMLLDKHEGVRLEAINGLASRQDKRVTQILAHELEKDIAYDDFVESAGKLGDISLLPILKEMVNRFDEFDILNLAIEKLEKLEGLSS